MNPHKRQVQLFVAVLLVLTLGALSGAGTALAQGASRMFPETGKIVSGKFLKYWNEHGGLAQQGYPITGEMQEVSPLNGKTYTVQYFERAVFELHPENQAPYDVLLSQLGTFRYKAKYPNGAPNQQVSTDNPRLFPETGHTVGGVFRTYWEQHGGLAQQGYPISDEFQEISDEDGQTYTVQYFERAVFEWHPENQPPYDVLLSQLGKSHYEEKNSLKFHFTSPKYASYEFTLIPQLKFGFPQDFGGIDVAYSVVEGTTGERTQWGPVGQETCANYGDDDFGLAPLQDAITCDSVQVHLKITNYWPVRATVLPDTKGVIKFH